VAALTKPDPLPPHSAIDRDPDYYDPAQAAADAAYRRKTVSEPGYDPGARAAYCCQCANRAPDKRCLAWERIGAREGWKPADKAPRRCRGYEPVTPAAIIRKAAADGVSLALSPAGTIKATGDQAAVSQWVPFLREHKPALLAALARPDPPTLSPDLASRLSPEDLADIAAGDIPLGTIQQYEQAAIAREAEDLREFLEERVGTPSCPAPTPSLRLPSSRQPSPETALTRGHPYGQPWRTIPCSSLRGPPPTAR
jgi:hypothetical protein